MNHKLFFLPALINLLFFRLGRAGVFPFMGLESLKRDNEISWNTGGMLAYKQN